MSMNSLSVSLAGMPLRTGLPLVLTYSNVEAVPVCFSESFEALVAGLERCL
jgi:hypothetical protein